MIAVRLGLPNPWPTCPKLPPGAAAVLAALHFSEPDLTGLLRLSESEWRDALDFSYRSQLALVLRRAARAHMPEWARARTDEDAAKNVLRSRNIRGQYDSLAASLAPIEFVALKGMTQCGLSGMSPEERAQYDIDVYCPRNTIEAARDALLALGYEPMEGMEAFPTDHLPPLIRKTGWQWRGDFFDLEIPVSIELHHQFWNATLDRLPAPGVDEFWTRRTKRDGLPALSPPDALAYTALHVLKHILHGNLRPFHVYELALILDRQSSAEAIWRDWLALQGTELRRLQAAAFLLARQWFGCAVPPAAREEIERLPAGAQSWFDEFSTSPVTRKFHPNKDELWLHLSLLTSRRDAWSVTRRKLIPDRLPAPVDAVYVPESELTLPMRIRRQLRYAAYVAKRVRHHAIALPQLALGAAQWKFRVGSLGEQFRIFLAAAALFNFALFIFVLLYNLRLLELGYREDFLGVLQTSSTAGTVIGTLPAAWIARRFGLRGSLLGAFAVAAVLMAARSLVTGRMPLAALAFVWGLMFAVWAVIFSPVIAGTVDDRRRPAAYSAFFACMFGVGIAGDWIGGRLPRWLGGKQEALLLASVLVTAALIPAWRLRSAPQLPGESKIYPRSRFLAGYLGAFAVWSLATGSFNPFANAFFARQHFPVERIGNVFSTAQLAQVGAVLLAPLVFRKAGLAGGIAWMVAATGLGLAGLAAQPPGLALAAAYIAYMSFQWMSEPGLSSMLMNNVNERERGGAAALNYLVSFSAQALASFAAGWAVTRAGYGPVLACSAALAMAAAVMFRRL